MRIFIHSHFATSLDDNVINRILNLYPEEKLWQRPIFEQAILTNSLDIGDLKDECDKILIPWQMFFLTTRNLEKQLKHIEKLRKFKVSPKLLSKRSGEGNITSKRIIDRLIRQQNFLKDQIDFKCGFSGDLCGKNIPEAAIRILQYFEIDQVEYWNFSSKEKTLNYFIKKVEKKYINICRGVLTNKLLPALKGVINDVYKNTSGFVIKDEKIPFIFLPNEINPEESFSRQLYTLIFLLIVIGLNEYSHILEKNFSTKLLKARGLKAKIHAITSELLMPREVLESLNIQTFTQSDCDNLSQKFKVTPTALVTTLKMRGMIDYKQYLLLKPPEYLPVKSTRKDFSHPKMSTSIEKFCGGHTFKALCTAIKNGSLENTQAQYLIYGTINKRGFRRFRSEIGS